jgi:hypothetical protein
VWNHAGTLPDRFSQMQDVLWSNSSQRQREEQGLKVLVTLSGAQEYIHAHTTPKMDEGRVFLNELPHIHGFRNAWALLSLCAAPRCNHLLRALPPPMAADYASSHDEAIWNTFAAMVGVPARRENRLVLPEASRNCRGDKAA